MNGNFLLCLREGLGKDLVDELEGITVPFVAYFDSSLDGWILVILFVLQERGSEFLDLLVLVDQLDGICPRCHLLDEVEDVSRAHVCVVGKVDE